MDKVAQSDQLFCIHLNLGETRNQPVGQLIVTAHEAEHEGRDRVETPSRPHREKEVLLALSIVSWLLATQFLPE